MKEKRGSNVVLVKHGRRTTHSCLWEQLSIFPAEGHHLGVCAMEKNMLLILDHIIRLTMKRKWQCPSARRLLLPPHPLPAHLFSTTASRHMRTCACSRLALRRQCRRSMPRRSTLVATTRACHATRTAWHTTALRRCTHSTSRPCRHARCSQAACQDRRQLRRLRSALRLHRGSAAGEETGCAHVSEWLACARCACVCVCARVRPR